MKSVPLLLLALVACRDREYGTSTPGLPDDPVDSSPSSTDSPTVPPTEDSAVDTAPTAPTPCAGDAECAGQVCRGASPGVAGSGTCQPRLDKALPEACR